MKKSLLTIYVILSLFICSVSCQAQENAYHWYPKRNKTHEQPILESQFQFIKNYNAVYLGAEKNEKKIFLTFDVGYENGNTEKILNILKEENVPAAFFVLSHFVECNTDLVLRMQTEGHLVCNHSAKHKDMTKLSKDEFEKEITFMEKLVFDKTGRPIDKFYRPPRGIFNESNLKWAEELGYRTVFWSLCYADWDNQKQPNMDYARNLLLDNTHPGVIVLLHPTSSTNANILQKLIRTWKEEGYEFSSLIDIH